MLKNRRVDKGTPGQCNGIKVFDNRYRVRCMEHDDTFPSMSPSCAQLAGLAMKGDTKTQLPLATHGIGADKAAYLMRKGSGNEQSTRLGESFLPGKICTSSLLENRTHITMPPSKASDADGVLATTRFDPNCSQKFNAMQRGPTGSDLSAQWQASYPIRDIELIPPGTPQSDNQLVLVTTTSVQSPYVSVSTPLTLPTPPNDPLQSSSAAMTPPTLNSSANQTSITNAQHITPHLPPEHKRLSTTIQLQAMTQSPPPPQRLSYAQATSFFSNQPQTLAGTSQLVQAVQNTVPSRQNTTADPSQPMAHKQAQVANQPTAMFGGIKPSVVQYMMASGMFDYGFGTMRKPTRAAQASTGPAVGGGGSDNKVVAQSNLEQLSRQVNPTMFMHHNHKQIENNAAISKSATINGLPTSLHVKQEATAVERILVNEDAQSPLAALWNGSSEEDDMILNVPPPPPAAAAASTGINGSDNGASGGDGKTRKRTRVEHKPSSEHQCAECDARFPWKSTLNNHIRLVHRKERPFKCGQCNKAFRWSSHLEEHTWVTHQGLKPFVCEICGKAFGRKNNMQKHRRKVHKLEDEDRTGGRK